MRIIETKFKKMVWNKITKVHRGKTITYKQITINIGRPFTLRAIANACSKNTYQILIPSHRVNRTNCSLGGYMGHKNSDIKKKLLCEEV